MRHICIALVLVLLCHTNARAQTPPATLQTMWSLDATYTDPAHGVSFRYPSTWTATKTAVSYHGPALLGEETLPVTAAFAFSEEGFPHESPPRGPYASSSFEAVYIAYTATAGPTLEACKKLANGLAQGEEPHPAIIHGIGFFVYSTSDAGMSQSANGLLYATFAHGNCYLFETSIAALSDGSVADVPNLTPQQMAYIQSHLHAIVETIRFSVPKH